MYRDVSSWGRGCVGEECQVVGGGGDDTRSSKDGGWSWRRVERDWYPKCSRGRVVGQGSWDGGRRGDGFANGCVEDEGVNGTTEDLSSSPDCTYTACTGSVIV